MILSLRARSRFVFQGCIPVALFTSSPLFPAAALRSTLFSPHFTPPAPLKETLAASCYNKHPLPHPFMDLS